jgi:hypothetical protein
VALPVCPHLSVRISCLGRTPLHVAACEGHALICEILLEAGANPHFKDRWDMRACSQARPFSHGRTLSFSPLCRSSVLALLGILSVPSVLPWLGSPSSQLSPCPHLSPCSRHVCTLHFRWNTTPFEEALKKGDPDTVEVFEAYAHAHAAANKSALGRGGGGLGGVGGGSMTPHPSRSQSSAGGPKQKRVAGPAPARPESAASESAPGHSGSPKPAPVSTGQAPKTLLPLQLPPMHRLPGTAAPAAAGGGGTSGGGTSGGGVSLGVDAAASAGAMAGAASGTGVAAGPGGGSMGAKGRARTIPPLASGSLHPSASTSEIMLAGVTSPPSSEVPQDAGRGAMAPSAAAVPGTLSDAPAETLVRVPR